MLEKSGRKGIERDRIESPTKIIPLQLSDGTVINVEVTPIGEQPVSARTRVFKEATKVIKAIANSGISRTTTKTSANGS